MNSRLNEKVPTPPENVPEDAVPIVAMLEVGDIMFGGLGRQNLMDVGPACHDVVFDVVTQRINRFAFHKYEGEDTVIGWVWHDGSDYQYEIRQDVLNSVYANKKRWQDNPHDIDEAYYAYKDTELRKS